MIRYLYWFFWLNSVRIFIQVFVHDPYDFPDDNAETKAISSKMISFLMVYPETTYSTAEVRSLSPAVRYCYFHDEHQLHYMQRYSYTNCLAECRTEIAYRLCGCVPFFLPNNGSYRVCEMNEMMCARENRPAYFGALPGLNKTIIETAEPNIHHTPCGCLPDCQLNQYPTEITSALLNRTYSFSQMGLLWVPCWFVMKIPCFDSFVIFKVTILNSFIFLRSFSGFIFVTCMNCVLSF